MKLFVAGTDTDVGKTVFSAALAGALGACYWKPIQAGNLERTDSEIVGELSGLPRFKIIPEAYRLTTPCSPHRAAELDCVSIDVAALKLPEADSLVVEGAGGLMVPITRKLLMMDLIAKWKLPAVLVARTSLGTINHSLLSIQALRSRKIPLVGIAFVGEANLDSEQVICAFAKAKWLGRLPLLNPLNREFLADAFASNFALRDFQ